VPFVPRTEPVLANRRCSRRFSGSSSSARARSRSTASTSATSASTRCASGSQSSRRTLCSTAEPSGRCVFAIWLCILRSVADLPCLAQNLDPTSSKADVELNLALQKAGLVAPAGASDDVKARYAKFQLDHMVTDEGSNMSAGERQLLALCRALVKNSRIIVLVRSSSFPCGRLVSSETDPSRCRI